MIPTIQFDPATLTVWTTLGQLATLGDPELRAAVDAAMAAALDGGDPREAASVVPAGAPRRRVLWLASCAWHEKRHFLDTCLTNYGARRFRELFQLAANLWPLAAYARSRQEPMWLPVETYACPVQRRRFGISEPPNQVQGLAARARAAKRLSAELDAPLDIDGQALALGGAALMEGLAQSSQAARIASAFGHDVAVEINRERVQRLPLTGAYRAIELVALALGCSRETAPGIAAVEPELAAALFVTALCGRYMGGETMPDIAVNPGVRLTRLFHAARDAGVGGPGLLPEEAWDIADRLAKRVLGRTALEELEFDVAAMASHSARWDVPHLAQEHLPDAWRDFVSLRERMVDQVRRHGPALLGPGGFGAFWCDRLAAWHVVATPGGEAAQETGPDVLHGRHFDRQLAPLAPPLVVWARRRPIAHTADRFAVADDRAWTWMLEQHAPRAKLMLNGRRHRLMLPVELERAVSVLNQGGVEVRFRPEFAAPPDRDDETRAAEAAEVAAFAQRDSFRCDITGAPLAPAQARVLTAWEFRRSPLVGRYRAEMAKAFPGAGAADVALQVRLETDWSDWIVDSRLLADPAAELSPEAAR